MIKLKVSEKIRSACVRDGKGSSITFYNELKQPVRCVVTGEAKVCFWDRNIFDGEGIRCPVSYKPTQLVRTYRSDVSKEEYTIKENVRGGASGGGTSGGGTNGGGEVSRSEYEFDGKFCSYQCCLAYVRDNKHNNLYNQSETLLYKMYLGTTSKGGTKVPILRPAPHWRTLRECGGHLSIKEFRQTFGVKVYECRGYVSLKASDEMPDRNLCHLFEQVMVFD